MNKLELQPTKENIFKTFINDSIERDKDICYFISLLDSLDESNSIAINSEWGSGKTFFVKQIEMVLGVHNDFFLTTFEESDKNLIISHYSNLCRKLNVDEIKNLYLPIYYDAWKYDNDDDPVLSIVYEIISTLNNKYGFEEIDINFSKILKGITEALNLSGVYDLITSIKSDDDLKSIVKSRDLKSKIDEFLDQIPIERADKVVIFIDELDRCKPTYAVKLLERIKHYFNNDKILFVFSTNLEELQSSVKCVYGEKFNTMIVCQIARSICNALNANQSLTEAIAIGHDLGHTPFGHIGERTLNEVILETEPNVGGFKHNYQGIRVVSKLEKTYYEIDGLDLSYQVIEGIFKHGGLQVVHKRVYLITCIIYAKRGYLQ